jgi:hypothetical protein
MITAASLDLSGPSYARAFLPPSACYMLVLVWVPVSVLCLVFLMKRTNTSSEFIATGLSVEGLREKLSSELHEGSFVTFSYSILSVSVGAQIGHIRYRLLVTSLTRLGLQTRIYSSWRLQVLTCLYRHMPAPSWRQVLVIYLYLFGCLCRFPVPAHVLCTECLTYYQNS